MKPNMHFKKRFHVVSMISASVLLVGLFQNCGQKGELSLTSDVAVEAQTMTNTFYILKNSDKNKLKPILSNQEAVALRLQAINNSSGSVASAPDSADSLNGLNEVIEFVAAGPLPLETQHGTVFSVDKETGLFEYSPRKDAMGEEIFNIIKKTKLEVTSATKNAVKSEDGKYYLETNQNIAIKVVIHDHLISDVKKSDISGDSSSGSAYLNPVERDKFSPEKPNLFDDGSFPDEIAKTPKISWEHSFDKDSGINYYEVAIGTKAGGTDIKTWTNVGFVSSVILEGAFKEDETYYASIRAVDFAGLRSEIAQGDGWLASKLTSDSLVAKITAPATTMAAKIDFKIQFTQIVPKLLLTQLSILNINGTPVLTGSGRSYTLSVEGKPEGTILFKIPTGSITDVFGNKNKVDFSASVVRPKTPTLVAFGTIPNNLTETPKITWPDAGNSDAGWASYTANVYDGTQKIKSQPNFVKGNAVSDLKLNKDKAYTVRVQGVDLSGNLGLESFPVGWTATTKSELVLISGSGKDMDVVANSSDVTYGNWVEFVFQNKGGEVTPGQIQVAVSNSTNYEIWTDTNKTPVNVPYKRCYATSVAPSETCSVFIRPKASTNGAFTNSNLLLTGIGATLNPAPVPLSGKASGFVFRIELSPSDLSGHELTTQFLKDRKWNGLIDAVVTLKPGDYTSGNPTTPTLTVKVDLAAGTTLKLINNGRIIGCGGYGKDTYKNGGIGLKVLSYITLENNNIIAGGGGAGGYEFFGTGTSGYGAGYPDNLEKGGDATTGNPGSIGMTTKGDGTSGRNTFNSPFPAGAGSPGRNTIAGTAGNGGGGAWGSSGGYGGYYSSISGWIPRDPGSGGPAITGNAWVTTIKAGNVYGSKIQ
jgi:hypothetical protein